MSEAVVRPAPYAQARIREPAGDRTLGETFSIGGVGADIVVPGSVDGPVLRVERRKGMWVLHPDPSVNAQPIPRFDGRPLTSPRDLRRNDVVALGDAQLIVTDVSRTLLRLQICHLVGNATIAPAATLATLTLGEGGDEELEIQARGLPVISKPKGIERRAADPWRRARNLRTAWVLSGVLVVGLAVVLVVSLLESLSLDITPGDAHVRTPGTLLALHSGSRLLVLPGRHVVRAEREGFIPAQTDIEVRRDSSARVRLRLTKLPGRLHIETGGIAAAVIVDGVDAGHAPGDLEVAAGDRTITLRAPKYLDFSRRVRICGAGERQELSAVLEPAWGSVAILSVPAGAQIKVDGVASGTAPATVAVLSGVRHVELAAPGLKSWQSSVVVKAGTRLTLGPVTLGQADAHLSIHSQPAGAEVTIAGTHRGRTPLEADLASGVAHDVVLDLPGHASWNRSVFAAAGRRIDVAARLQAVLTAVTVQGEPSGAQLLIDGVDRGRTPRTLQLEAVEHRIEVRREGFLPFNATVTPAAGLERTLQYHLASADPAIALQDSAPLITTGTGYALRLIPAGTFSMGSDRREQGRRPNEGLRQVTLKRASYLGVTEITNEAFRQFRPEHRSGFIGTHSLDLDAQAVTQVSWNDAVEYCNWLSERDALPPAYEKQGSRYALKRPVTAGYRLPTEAEWEYAARYAGPGRFRRFAWGDELPIQAQVGNLAGTEVAGALPASLVGYRDDYPVVAPVGKFKPTLLGLHDLSGNVSEWVNDYYLSFVDSLAVVDPLGPDDGTRHVVRGANWKSASVSELRLAWRDSEDGISPTLGFRIARGISPTLGFRIARYAE
jgi:formylglycine-generating enzyme required for sulfatase activity